MFRVPDGRITQCRDATLKKYYRAELMPRASAKGVEFASPLLYDCHFPKAIMR